MALDRGTLVAATTDTGTTVTAPSVNQTGRDGCLVLIAGRTGSQGTATGVTFNGSGTGWSRIGTAYVASGITMDIWWGAGLTSTTADIVATFGSGIDTSVWIAAIPYGGAHATPTGTPSDMDGSGSDIEATVSSATGEEVIAFLLSRTTGVLGALAPDSGQTELYEAEEAAFGSTFAVTAEAGAASVACGWTGYGFVSTAMRAVSVIPAAGSAPNRRMMLIGVG